MKRGGRVAFIFMLFLIFILFAVIFLATNYNSVTGDSVYVRDYGVSNYPLKNFSGKIQTYVKLDRESLSKLNVAGTSNSVAKIISEASNFEKSIASLYKAESPAPVPNSAFEAVVSSSKLMTERFSEDTACLREIGSLYKDRDNVEFVIVTDLVYGQCSLNELWLYAVPRHLYYTKSGKLLCSQMGLKLFSLEMETGKTSSLTFGC